MTNSSHQPIIDYYQKYLKYKKKYTHLVDQINKLIEEWSEKRKEYLLITEEIDDIEYDPNGNDTIYNPRYVELYDKKEAMEERFREIRKNLPERVILEVNLIHLRNEIPKLEKRLKVEELSNAKRDRLKRELSHKKEIILEMSYKAKKNRRRFEWR